MRRHVVTSALVARAIALATVAVAARPAHAQFPFAFSRGEKRVVTATVQQLPAQADGSACVHVSRGGRNAAHGGPGAGAVFRVNGNEVDGVDCAIQFGQLHDGRGLLDKAKLPAPKSATAFAEFAPPGGVKQAAGAWFSTRVGPAGPEALLHSDASFRGGVGFAISQARDPWYFTPSSDMDLTLQVILDDVALGTGGVGSFAALRAAAAFGRGTTPGSMVLASDVFYHAITGTAGYSLPRAIALIDRTFTLQAGQTYWLTADLTSVAQTAPEPASPALLAGGLLALGGVAARQRLARA